MGKIMLNGVDYSAAVTSGAIEAVTQDYYTIVGVGAKATGLYSTAVGSYTNAKTNNTTALGSYSAALDGYSTALGSYANANGYGATALGYNASVCGKYSMALGYNATAGGAWSNSVALGPHANANGDYSLALGYNTYADGAFSPIAIGCSANANSSGAIAVGGSALARYGYSISLGEGSRTESSSAIAIGHDAKASGSFSAAVGPNTNASGYHSTSLGVGAATSNANSIQLGNASSLSSITSKVAITVTSDARDKADITKMEDGALAFLSKVTPIRYVFNGRELYIDEDNLSDEERSKKNKFGLCTYDRTEHGKGTKKGSRIRVGVSAQNVQQALEAIYGNDSYANLVNNNLFDFDLNEIPEGVESQLAVNYEGFIPFLIKAVQELAAKVEQLQEKEDE